MLESLAETPPGVRGLRATGVVVAADVAQALAAAQPDAAAGLVVVIDPDFDGYLAELMRGLAAAAAAPAPAFARVALVAPDDMLAEAGRHGGEVRLFPASRRAEALAYAAGKG
ncbi:MAG: hypothetical protein ACR652_02300 [Methylocystis sp.]|uniref:hypothetical protein n=1 Tax=Methylocystis sp. TaxID=1911079 RepID=UPI003DA1E116